MPYDGSGVPRARTLKFETDMTRLAEEWGIHLDGVVDYTAPEWKRDYRIAMDALGMDAVLPGSTPPTITAPNSGIPFWLAMTVDPALIRVLVTPSNAAKIMGESRKGSWTDETAMFTMVEHTGEVSSYGDYSNQGRSGLNVNYPMRQSYLFQTVISYGEREIDRAGLARVGWASEVKQSAVLVLNKFSNLCYFFGVSGLLNFGLLNDPALSPPLTPSLKAAGNGNVWIYQGAPNATANEIFSDIQALFYQLVTQTQGLVSAQDPLVLGLSPPTATALLTTNSFNVSVGDLVKKHFPNLRIEEAVQYGATSPTNPQGIGAGETVQLIAERVDGQDVGFMAFNEKLRTHPLIREMSAFKQKFTQGVWGCILRYPMGISQMVGV